LLAALSGERPLVDARAIVLNGVAVGRLGAAVRRRLGMTFVPEERLGRGAVPEMSLAENALLTAHRQELTRHGFIRPDAVRAYAQATIARFSVKAPGPDATARSRPGAWMWAPRRSSVRPWSICATRESRYWWCPKSSTSCWRSAIASPSSPAADSRRHGR